MYKRKKHQGALHHHMTKDEKAEHDRLEAERGSNGEGSEHSDAKAPTSFFGKLLARLHDVAVVKKAETLLRERVLETPAGHVVRSALGYAAKGRFSKAVGAVRRGVKEQKSETSTHATEAAAA